MLVFQYEKIFAYHQNMLVVQYQKNIYMSERHMLRGFDHEEPLS